MTDTFGTDDAAVPDRCSSSPPHAVSSSAAVLIRTSAAVWLR
ncbi:hypothetical protein [Streptomyces sp. NPDC018045]